MKKRKTIKESKEKRKGESKGEREFLGFVPEATFDYHGLGPLTSYDIEKHLFNFLEDSYFERKENVLVITGKGKVVRPLVEKLLKKNKYVKTFRSGGYFNGQEGAFEVVLKNDVTE